jgi:hypothetical protein
VPKGNNVGLCLVLAFANIALAWGQSPSGVVYEGFVVSATDENKLGNVICQTLDANKESRGYTFSDEIGDRPQPMLPVISTEAKRSGEIPCLKRRKPPPARVRASYRLSCALYSWRTHLTGWPLFLPELPSA